MIFFEINPDVAHTNGLKHLYYADIDGLDNIIVGDELAGYLNLGYISDMVFSIKVDTGEVTMIKSRTGRTLHERITEEELSVLILKSVPVNLTTVR